MSFRTLTRMNNRLRLAIILLFLPFSTTTRAQSITGLGDLPGVNFRSIEYGVSGDGKVAVGVSNSDVTGATFVAFQWIYGTISSLGCHAGRGSQARRGTSFDAPTIVKIKYQY